MRTFIIYGFSILNDDQSTLWPTNNQIAYDTNIYIRQPLFKDCNSTL